MSKSLAARLLWLVACIALGTVVALVGWSMTGSERWFLAIPGALAAGWFYFADPQACEPRRDGDGPTGPR